MSKPTFEKVMHLVFCLLLLLIGFKSTSVRAQESCETTGVEFGFFNGVQNTKSQADMAVVTLKLLYPPTTPDDQPITYTLYYNDTDAGLADFVETFDQRLQEQGGLLVGRALSAVFLDRV